jgi:transketolase
MSAQSIRLKQKKVNLQCVFIFWYEVSLHNTCYKKHITHGRNLLPRSAKNHRIGLMPDTNHCPSTSVTHIQKIAYELRENVVDMILEAGTGHIASSLGTAEIFASLYFNILDIDPKKPNATTRDRFVLSNGHICPILYATLAKKGFFNPKELWTLRKPDSNLQGHPVYKCVPGIETTSGSLGQGLSQAIGMALAAKMGHHSYRIYCLSGDGELQEGQIWEAAMFAPNKRLDNLTWIIDRNNIQIDGYTENVMPLEDLRAKLEAFNWFVLEIDGHNVEEIINSCKMAESISQRPTAIIAHTIPGKGVDFMEYKVEWHGKPPNKAEAHKALKELRTLRGKVKNEYD